MAILLPDSIITAAATLVGPTFDLKAAFNKLPLNLTSILKFTYGSGGTTINVYLQGSFDNVFWADLSAFNQIATASSKQIANNTRQSKLIPTSMSDAAIAAGTQVDGVIPPLLRAKVVSVGTYAGNSTLRLDIYGEA